MGPEVIEQEAGTNEFDAHDRVLIWQTLGCRRRLALGQIDLLVDDSVDAVTECIVTQINIGVTPKKQQGTVARTREIAGQPKKIGDGRNKRIWNLTPQRRLLGMRVAICNQRAIGERG